MFKLPALCSAILIIALNSYGQSIDVTTMGAKGDTLTNNTVFIQAAIDKAAVSGETVVIPAGVFITGTLFLKSNVTLLLQKNAVLKGIADMRYYPGLDIAYPQRHAAGPQHAKSLIFAEAQKHITITGDGTIDGSGAAPAFDERLHPGIVRPYGLFFVGCEDIIVSGIRLRNSAMWMQRYLNCSFIRLQDLQVFNHSNLNNDGLDIDDCHEIIVSNCIIDADDDALCFKSEGDRGVKNAVVSNCILSSHASALKMGTGSIGGFESVQISNIVIRPSLAPTLHHPYKQKGGLTGIDIASVDGAIIKGINISNISIDSVETPLFIKLGKRLGRTSVTPANKQGQITHVNISQVYVQNAGPIASAITGYPDHSVNNISLRDLFIEHRGGGTVADTSLKVPENAEAYPLNRMFDNKKLPACGLYIRHAENILLDNIQVVLMNNDVRPLLLIDDVQQATVRNISLNSKDNIPLIRMNNSDDIRINGKIGSGNLKATDCRRIQLNGKEM